MIGFHIVDVTISDIEMVYGEPYEFWIPNYDEKVGTIGLDTPVRVIYTYDKRFYRTWVEINETSHEIYLEFLPEHLGEIFRIEQASKSVHEMCQ